MSTNSAAAGLRPAGTRTDRIVITSIAVSMMAALTLGIGRADAQTPPTQPASGPGGSSYPHGSCITWKHAQSNDDLTYWTVEPRSPTPAKAPIVVFSHGWMGNDPSYYAEWLNHLCRKGNIVIFPKYQNAWTLASFMTNNAIWSIKDAIAQMTLWSPAKPDTAKGMVLIGHSMGGIMSVNVANRWNDAGVGLPQPKAVFAVEPGDGGWGIVDNPMNRIPATAKLVCLVGEQDTVVGRTFCDQIWDRTAHIPASNRNYVWMYSDTTGTPDLIADHYAPGGNPIDALDWYGSWKLGDALRDCGFLGSNCTYGIGGGASMTFMGTWSNGVAVKKLSVTTYKP